MEQNKNTETTWKLGMLWVEEGQFTILKRVAMLALIEQVN